MATFEQHPPKPSPRRRTHPTRESLRFFLVGKTGSGKSATANCILGGECFASIPSFISVTNACQKEVGEVDGQQVTVVDTPGLFDTKLTNEQIQQELMNCISMLAPGPHVFLLVLSIGRFTKEEKETVELIKTFFGERAGDFTIILFTRADELRGRSLTEYLQTADKTLRDLMFECGNRYLAFDSTDIHNRGQVRELLKMVEAMVTRNGGSYYTSGMFTEAEEAIQKETQKILKRKEWAIRRETRELEARKQAEENNEFKKRYTRDMAAEREEQQHEEQQKWEEKIISHLIRKKPNKIDYDSLKKRQDEEVKLLLSDCSSAELEGKKSQLQLQHRNEIKDWIEERVQMAISSRSCTIL